MQTAMTIDRRIVLPDFGSHFYLPSGEPFYSVPNKSKPGQMRAARVDDARKAGAFPSVTGILGMVHRYALQAWIESQYILAGAMTERLEAEEDDAFCRRIRDEGKAEAIAAAEWGVQLHQAIADATMGLECASEALRPFVEGWRAWARDAELIVEETELCFADVGERYGGRADCLGSLRGSPVLIDWQSSKTMVTYAEKYAQVVAYQRGLKVAVRPLIVIISSVTPGLIEEHGVKDEEASWRVFQDAKSLYFGEAGPWKD